jgi:magnesium-transporting ATPase (P-type)
MNFPELNTSGKIQKRITKDIRIISIMLFIIIAFVFIVNIIQGGS